MKMLLHVCAAARKDFYFVGKRQCSYLGWKESQEIYFICGYTGFYNRNKNVNIFRNQKERDFS